MMSDGEVVNSGGESSIDELDLMEEVDESSTEDNTPLQYNYEYIPEKHTVSNDAKQRERIQKIEDAATNIQRVLQKFGDASLPSINPDDTKGSWEIDKSIPWADPSLAIKEIITAREELCKAWDREDNNDGGGKGSGELTDGINNTHQTEEDKDKWWKSVLQKDDNSSKEIDSHRTHINNKDREPPLTKEEEQQFKEIYMEWATNAYSVELNALREGELGALTSARRKQKSTVGPAGSKNDKSAAAAVELDPTQYSFIVENNKKKDTKKEVEQVDVKVLGDMIASGSYALSNTEKRMLLQARQRAIEKIADSRSTDRDDDVGISLHERRKLELGF